MESKKQKKRTNLNQSLINNKMKFSRAVGSSRVGVSWARTRTYGGRNRGSRGAPYGSYRNSGGRRRSR